LWLPGWRSSQPEQASPNYQYFRTNLTTIPTYPEVPRWETVIAARDRWLGRNPGLIIIGAHFAAWPMISMP